MSPILFDEGKAAVYLGGEGGALSKKTLQAMRVRGDGPMFVKIGRLVRYRQSDLDQYIDSRAVRSTSEKPGE